MKENDLAARCPVEYALQLLSGKWKMLAIWQIHRHGTIRYNELKRQLPGISGLVLTQTLQKLQEAGVVVRRQYNEVPPRVEYSLTALGQGVIPIFTTLDAWGRQCGWEPAAPADERAERDA